MTQKNILYKKGLFIIALLSTPFVNGRADVTLAQVTSAATSALDKINGDFYVGTTVANGDGSITKIATDGTTTEIAANIAFSNHIIRLLTLSMNGDTARVVGVSGTGNKKAFSVMSSDGATLETSDALTDSNDDAIVDDGIRAIAASSTKVYAAVADGGTDWAAVNRGIAVRTITAGTLALSAAAQALAVDIDAIGADTTTGSKLSVASAISVAVVAAVDPVLHYDSLLDRLYLGCDIATGGTAGNQVMSVLVRTSTGAALASVSEDITTGAATTKIITTLDAGATVSVSARNLGVMHTTTGHDYLIVNGGNDVTANVGNLVYALPLVPATDTTAAAVGTFAARNLGAGAFTQAATAADLCTSAQNDATVGGINTAHALPFTADTTTTMQVVGDTVFVASVTLTDAENDEAGIFSSTAQFNEHGKIVNWSRWTRACPAVLGTGAAGGDELVNGDVLAFAIDAKRGKTFAVDGANGANVAISSWGEEATTTATDLATAVNTDLTKGCYSILSLDRTVANFGNNAASRYAIFGGYEQVVFTLVSRKDADTVSYNKSETPVAATAFGTSPSATYNVISTGLSGTGKVTALGLKGLSTIFDSAYFLAGTENGLYALAKSDADGDGGGVGAGGTLDTANGNDHINNLNGDDTGAETNSNGFFKPNNVPTWQSVTTITREVKKIASSANATYVLESGGTSSTGDRLWVSNTADDTVANLSAGFLAIAEAGTNATNSDLRGFNYIYDFVVITGAADGTEDQVILATDNGLYQSKTDGGVQAEETQAAALWSPIGDKLGNSDTTGVIYTKLFTTPGTNLISSFYAKRYVDGSGSPETYMNSTIDLFCCSTANTGITGNVVKKSERNDGRNNGRYANSITDFLYPNRVQDLFTDGGRRWFVERSADGTSANNTQIRTMPFHVGSSDWSVTDPVTPLSNTTLDALGSINAISLLPNGYLALGTDTGIVLAS